MNEVWKLVVAVLIVAAVIAWAGVGSDGQPFHEPGQSNRSVIWDD